MCMILSTNRTIYYYYGRQTLIYYILYAWLIFLFDRNFFSFYTWKIALRVKRFYIINFLKCTLLCPTIHPCTDYILKLEWTNSNNLLNELQWFNIFYININVSKIEIQKFSPEKFENIKIDRTFLLSFFEISSLTHNNYIVLFFYRSPAFSSLTTALFISLPIISHLLFFSFCLPLLPSIFIPFDNFTASIAFLLKTYNMLEPLSRYFLSIITYWNRSCTHFIYSAHPPGYYPLCDIYPKEDLLN